MVDGVKFISISATHYSDREEMPSAMGLPVHLSNSEILRYGLGNPYGERHDMPLIRVEFESNEDLVRLSKEDGFHIIAHAYICDDKNESFISFTHIYTNHKDIRDLSINKGELYDGSRIYYFFAKMEEKRSGFEMLYDLREEARDVCFRLSGGVGATRIRSNVVKVPRNALLKAVAKS